MTLTELKYLIMLAKEKHFGKAAQACFVTQPTLSIGIKQLEKELEFIFFERNKNQISLTKDAEPLLAQAQKVLEEAEKLKTMAASSKNQMKGVIKIGAIFTIGPYLLPQLIPRLRQLAPNIPLIVEEDFTANLREKLANGKLDAIIISLPFNQPNIVTKPLYEEKFVALLPIDHPLTKEKNLTAKQLGQAHPLLLGEGHCFREQVLEYCPCCLNTSESLGIKPETVEGSSLETLRMMVASGLGMTVLPERAAKTTDLNQQLLTVRPFLPPTPKRTVALAWRSSFPRVKVIDLFLRALA